MTSIRLSPKEYTNLLMKLVDEGKVKTDNYSNGGIVEELENKFATLLGKESAVFMPYRNFSKSHSCSQTCQQ